METNETWFLVDQTGEHSGFFSAANLLDAHRQFTETFQGATPQASFPMGNGLAPLTSETKRQLAAYAA